MDGWRPFLLPEARGPNRLRQSYSILPRPEGPLSNAHARDVTHVYTRLFDFPHSTAGEGLSTAWAPPSRF